MHPTAVCAFAVLLAISGCGRSGDSFAGAENLPTAAELSRETIQINRDSAVGRQDHFLTYQLKPDNSLTVTHELGGYQGDKIVGIENFQLAAADATTIREALRRFRPAKLEGVEYLVYPDGCEPPIDSGMEVAIAFFGVGDRIGIFALPYACEEGNSARARTAFNELLDLLPYSKVAQSFPESS